MKTKREIILIEPIFFGSNYIRAAEDMGFDIYIIARKTKAHFVNARNHSMILVNELEFEEVLEAIERNVKNLQELIIVQGNDYCGGIVSQLQKYFHIRHMSEEDVKAAHNKVDMRRKISLINDILNPKFVYVDKNFNMWDKVAFPCVIKPIDMTCSMFVKCVYNSCEAAEHLEELRKINDNYGYMIDSGCLVEEYIAYDEYSYDGIIYDDEIKFSSVVKKIKGREPYFVEMGHTTYNGLSLPQLDYIEECLSEFVLESGMVNTPFHVEFRYDGNADIKIMEYASRFPGGCITELYDRAYGFDIFKSYLSLLIGEKVIFPKIKHRDCCIKHFDFSPGKIVRIDGIETASKLPGVVRIDMDISAGDVISEMKENTDRYGYFVICMDDGEKIHDVIEGIYSSICVEVENE